MGVLGKVYDVTKGKRFYGPGEWLSSNSRLAEFITGTGGKRPKAICSYTQILMIWLLLATVRDSNLFSILYIGHLM